MGLADPGLGLSKLHHTEKVSSWHSPSQARLIYACLQRMDLERHAHETWLSILHGFPHLVTCVEANPPKAFLCPLSQCTSLLTEASLSDKSGLET